jgi:hypothetical protein
MYQVNHVTLCPGVLVLPLWGSRGLCIGGLVAYYLESHLTREGF